MGYEGDECSNPDGYTLHLPALDIVDAFQPGRCGQEYRYDVLVYLDPEQLSMNAHSPSKY